jgi:hypothetical protein
LELVEDVGGTDILQPKFEKGKAVFAFILMKVGWASGSRDGLQ